MLLITSQPLDFDITKDKLDLSKSSNLSDHFDQDKIFKKAYEWLFNKLGHNEFIWCYKSNERNFSDHGHEHVLWTLDVPDDQCVAINSSAWNCVINNWPYIEDDIIKNISDDDYERLTDSCKGREEQTWDSSIFKNEDKGMEILIKSPVNEQFVVKKEWLCDYNKEVFDDKIGDGLISYFFRNEEELNQSKLVYESGLKGRNIKFSTKIEKHKDGYSLKINW
jgi:hypothetical protein